MDLALLVELHCSYVRCRGACGILSADLIQVHFLHKWYLVTICNYFPLFVYAKLLNALYVYKYVQLESLIAGNLNLDIWVAW
jgi:hypothetical protein